jgi:hypothetical protein
MAQDPALEDGFLTELQIVHGMAPQLRHLSWRHGLGKMYINIVNIGKYVDIIIPVVPHKAVAEVSE